MVSFSQVKISFQAKKIGVILQASFMTFNESSYHSIARWCAFKTDVLGSNSRKGKMRSMLCTPLIPSSL